MTDWQTTYKTNYEQRLRDQYDPATGERKLLLKWDKAEPARLCVECGDPIPIDWDDDTCILMCAKELELPPWVNV